ncbi:ABC transporter ATP-binding protein [Fodinicurvata sp. EGI_FJ10296]|uniref:ABC transporter ATP-binding protein n=1 Tax=Fodinicurvata sp. EGI_FJ10296 TaxID=3231908 RepID=UPI0034542A9F
MLALPRKLLDLMTRRDRLWLGALAFALVVAACLQLVSVASIAPFLSVAANPNVIVSNAALSYVYESFGFGSANQFLAALGGAAIVALVLANLFMGVVKWLQLWLINSLSHRISVDLLSAFLRQPYAFFLTRNSGELGASLLMEVQQVKAQVLAPLLQLLVSGTVVIALFIMLLVIEPIIATAAAVSLGGAYGVAYLAARRRLLRYGQQRQKANSQRFKLAGEAFGGIKDIKLYGREATFIRSFARPSWLMHSREMRAGVIRELPRYAMEVVTFGGILALATVLLLTRGGLETILPTLGILAFAGMRMMPKLQESFAAMAHLRGGMAALERVHTDMAASRHLLTEPCKSPATSNGQLKTLPLNEQLELYSVTFSYPGQTPPTLDALSLKIAARSTVGVVGPTGCGKTTLIDVILGLLVPDSGSLVVDGVEITDFNRRSWMNSIGYVPQHIYLTDDSVARNIAFGVPDDEIDIAAVRAAARTACIDEFITESLPAGYQTLVGDRGIRLSGGQRQRIGIARALYHNPEVLILDEATSALDTETETAVMAGVDALSGQKTILLIAHRLSTLRKCDSIVTLSHGKAHLSPQLPSKQATNPDLKLSEAGAAILVRFGLIGPVRKSLC